MASAAGERLKDALAAGHFREAERLLPAYYEEIEQLLSRASSSQQRQQALESFHNLLSLARVTRAHITAQLATLQRLSCYRYQMPRVEQHAWRVDA